MHRITFQNSGQLQDWVIDHLKSGDLVLTSGGRLSRQFIHRFREQRLSEHARSWRPMNVMSLNDWLEYIWQEMWPEYIIASKWRRLHIWMDVMKKVPPPSPFLEDLSVAEDLDRTYAILIRHLLNPAKRIVTQPLPEWSFEVTRIFEDQMEADGLIHPCEIPMLLSRIFSGDTMGSISHPKTNLPKRIILAGLDQSSPLEKTLFEKLDQIAHVTWLETTDPTPAHLDAMLLPDASQEADWVIEKALEASCKLPLHRIGIALTDMETYAGLFERRLKEILDTGTGTNWSAFNITMGRPLIRSSIAQAAILPLKLALQGQRRNHLISLIQSPYYGIWSSNRNILARLDRVWRKTNLNSGLRFLTASIKKEFPSESFLLSELESTLDPLLKPGYKLTVKEWNHCLRGIWEALKFPVIAGEEDRICWEHLQNGLAEFDRDLDNAHMDIKIYFQWISSFLAGELFSIKGYENAGLQVMGLIEARGLSFDRLFIVGMASGFLPQPARSLLFLSPEERRRVQGGTSEDQFRFGEVLFQKLIASSPYITLTRSEFRDGEPLLASPFWPQKENNACVDLWHTESPIWARCEWLSQARKGIESGQRAISTLLSSETCKGPVPIPDTISVTASETALACAFRFFVSQCLKIEPLDEPEPGISPLDRGNMLHQCLARFVEEVIEKGLHLLENWDEVKILLKRVASESLAPLSGQFPWQVELRRWLDEGSPSAENRGLLYQWLEQERHIWEKGFRWLFTEKPFTDLVPKGLKVRIRGRIDRVDYHPESGYVCRDYKTGKIPTRREVEELQASQMIPYILATRNGLIVRSVAAETPVTGSYIQIDAAGRINISDLSLTEDDWNILTQQWESMILTRFARMEKGDITPSPVPAPGKKDQGACKYCPFGVICGYPLIEYESQLNSQ
ncbi:MAG: PD-(D/E)XK nuclease family protein [bacterium]